MTNTEPPKPPTGFASCRVFAHGQQTTHLVRRSSTGGTPGDTLCGLTRFGDNADLPGWSIGGGWTGPDVNQTRCAECFATSGTETGEADTDTSRPAKSRKVRCPSCGATPSEEAPFGHSQKVEVFASRSIYGTYDPYGNPVAVTNDLMASFGREFRPEITCGECGHFWVSDVHFARQADR